MDGINLPVFNGGQRLDSGTQHDGRVLKRCLALFVYEEVYGIFRKRFEEAEQARDFLKLQNTRLQNGVEHVVRLFCVAENLFVVRHRRGTELFPAHLADVFAVEPQELIVIEHGGRFADAVDGECFVELFQRENFLVILRAPAEQRDVVRDDRREVAVFEEALKACGTVALRKL